MHQENLAAIDLNLLVALEALLAERNVTRAAERMGLSQPAMSRALARLRDLFDDPILVRSGHAMVPTPRALAVRAPLGHSLEAIRQTLAPPQGFDPRAATRSFVLSALDTTQVVILPALLEAIARDAPGIEVSTRPLASSEETYRQLASGSRDLAIGRFDSPPAGIRCEVLYGDRMVCLVRKGHPRIRGRLSLRRYVSESHLAAPSSRSGADLPFTVEGVLAQLGLTRRVVCTVENIAMAPLVVARTDLVCTAAGQTIAPFASGLGLRVLAPPFSVPALEIQLAWHERNERDGGHRWLREMVLAAGSGAAASAKQT